MGRVVAEPSTVRLNVLELHLDSTILIGQINHGKIRILDMGQPRLDILALLVSENQKWDVKYFP